MTRKSHSDSANALGWLASLKRKQQPQLDAEPQVAQSQEKDTPPSQALREEILVPATPARTPSHTDMPYWLRDADTSRIASNDIPEWLLEDIPEDTLEPDPPPTPDPEPAALAPAQQTMQVMQPVTTPVTQAIDAHNRQAGLDEDLAALERLIRAGERLDDVLATLENLVRTRVGLDVAT
ncbi:MAG: hypothetical protein AAFR22_26590, partial [Chloroflexota bacterium]